MLKPGLKPIAYLTCELKGRDLDSRLLIASLLLERGYSVVVGQQWSMFVNAILGDAPNGCVLFKTTNKIQADLMLQCKNRGHAVLAADEECLPANVEDYARTTDPSVANRCDLFLAQSELHRSALSAAYPALSDKIVVTGNARVDILRSAQTRKPLPKDYILVNTSFGVINSLWGDTAKAVDMWITAGGHAPGPETDALVKSRIDFEEAALVATRELIDQLIKNPALTVVIRPHPGEKPKLWTDRYGSVSNVVIVPRSDPVPWMQHALFLVHNESTTGVEASILGTKALNLSPGRAWSDLLVVKDVNVTVQDADQACRVLNDFMATGTWPKTRLDANALFPVGGAGATADLVIRTLPPPEKIKLPPWKPVQRTDVHKNKFTVGLGEVRAKLKRCRLQELEDSVFLATPL